MYHITEAEFARFLLSCLKTSIALLARRLCFWLTHLTRLQVQYDEMNVSDSVQEPLEGLYRKLMRSYMVHRTFPSEKH
jgi:hypothetical protein